VDVKIKERNNFVILDIEDNGAGIDKNSLTDKKSLGLMGMKERAVLFGGEVLIIGKKGLGTKVTLLIPLTSLKTD
jgi:signal transduction histidine kinase